MRPVIERDLVRWSKRQWFFCFILMAAVQVGALYWSSAKSLPVRETYPDVPYYSYVSPKEELKLESLELENPMLFAAASWQGFSGPAWLRNPGWDYSLPEKLPQPDYLNFAEASHAPSPVAPTLEPVDLTRRPFFAVQPSKPVLMKPWEPRSSVLSVSGDLAGRAVASEVKLPPQTHNDVLGSTVVEVGVDSDGAVLSARLLSGSGARKPDLDALAIAKQLRFAPLGTPRSGDRTIAWGKLAFQWVPERPGTTNGVPK